MEERKLGDIALLMAHIQADAEVKRFLEGKSPEFAEAFKQGAQFMADYARRVKNILLSELLDSKGG